MTIALFPGQGVQSAGMGAGLIDLAPDVFATASDVLGVDAVELCTEGVSGSADLETTRWAQPAVLMCSVAAFRALKDEPFTAVAGHSVGEYAALVASGALELGDALRLIVVRAEATEDAAKKTPGGMAAVMRIQLDDVRRICGERGVVLAADNGPGQFVISGPSTDLEGAIDSLKANGAKCRRLDVSAAFHSPIMAAAAAPLSTAIDAVTFKEPVIDLWSPTVAGPVGTPPEFRSVLIDQLTSPVRWRETVTGLAERHGATFCDLGPGNVAAGLTRRVVEEAEIRTLDMLVGSKEGVA